MITSTRTLLLAIHHPSRRVAAVLHRSLRAYTQAARAVLGAAERDWEQVRAACLRQGKLNTMMLATELRTRYRARTTPYPLHASLREALFSDLAAAICSHDALVLAREKSMDAISEQAAALGLDLLTVPPLEAPPEVRTAHAKLLRKQRELGVRPSWPSAPRTRPDEEGYQEALDRIAARTPDDPPAPRGQGRLDDLLHIGTRPLWFPRPDGPSGSRNFALLHSADDKFYALLYLLPGGDTHARPLAVPPVGSKRGQLVALNKEGKTVGRSTRPSSALCLPLALGRWHEETALAEAISNPRLVRVAKLIHRPAHRRFGARVPERFVLAVTIEQECPEPIPPTTYLGVGLDEQGLVAWCVQDRAGGPILARGAETGLVDLATRWREDRRMAMREGKLPPRAHHKQAEQVRHALHRLANHLVEVAQEHNALIGVQDTTYLRQQSVKAPIEEGGKAAPRSSAWHAQMAERNYRRAVQVSGELSRMLAYKLPRGGLLAPLSVSGISPRDCAACGARGSTHTACGLCGAPLGVHNSAAVTLSRIPGILDRKLAAKQRREEERRRRQEEEEDQDKPLVDKEETE